MLTIISLFIMVLFMALAIKPTAILWNIDGTIHTTDERFEQVEHHVAIWRCFVAILWLISASGFTLFVISLLRNH